MTNRLSIKTGLLVLTALTVAAACGGHAFANSHDQRIPANVDAGAILQQTINNANRCNPSSVYYQGYDCYAPISFQNQSGAEITIEQFKQQNMPPQAHGIYQNSDGSVELK